MHSVSWLELGSLERSTLTSMLKWTCWKYTSSDKFTYKAVMRPRCGWCLLSHSRSIQPVDGKTGSIIWAYQNSNHWLINLIPDAFSQLTGAWIAGTVDTSQYVEVDMLKVYKFRQVHIQGRDEALEWVTSFKLLYDDGSGNFQEYTDSGGNHVSLL